MTTWTYRSGEQEIMKCQWKMKIVTDSEWSPQENVSGKCPQLSPKEPRWPGTQVVFLSGPCFSQLFSILSFKWILVIKISVKDKLMHTWICFSNINMGLPEKISCTYIYSETQLILLFDLLDKIKALSFCYFEVHWIFLCCNWHSFCCCSHLSF